MNSLYRKSIGYIIKGIESRNIKPKIKVQAISFYLHFYINYPFTFL